MSRRGGGAGRRCTEQSEASESQVVAGRQGQGTGRDCRCREALTKPERVTSKPEGSSDHLRRPSGCGVSVCLSVRASAKQSTMQMQMRLRSAVCGLRPVASWSGTIGRRDAKQHCVRRERSSVQPADGRREGAVLSSIDAAPPHIHQRRREANRMYLPGSAGKYLSLIMAEGVVMSSSLTHGWNLGGLEVCLRCACAVACACEQYVVSSKLAVYRFVELATCFVSHTSPRPRPCPHQSSKTMQASPATSSR